MLPQKPTRAGNGWDSPCFSPWLNRNQQSDKIIRENPINGELAGYSDLQDIWNQVDFAMFEKPGSPHKYQHAKGWRNIAGLSAMAK